jgi:hypothetical protein
MSTPFCGKGLGIKAHLECAFGCKKSSHFYGKILSSERRKITTLAIGKIMKDKNYIGKLSV